MIVILITGVVINDSYFNKWIGWMDDSYFNSYRVGLWIIVSLIVGVN